jgi:hypothetical protein
VKKEQNGRKSLRRLKPTMGYNASKRRKKKNFRQLTFYRVSIPEAAYTQL